MLLKSIGRQLKLLKWYLAFSHAWSVSIFMLLVYLAVLDRFGLSELAASTAAGSLIEDAFLLLLKASASRAEPVIASFHAIILVSILFSYAREEGYEYVSFLLGSPPAHSYFLRLLAFLILASSPIALTKVVFTLSRDCTLVIREPIMFLAVLGKVLGNLLIFEIYLFFIYSSLAYIVPRSIYFLLFAAIELYVFEAPLGGLLKIYPLYFHLVVAAGSVSEAIAGSLLHFATALGLAAWSIYVHIRRGEVKWR